MTQACIRASRRTALRRLAIPVLALSAALIGGCAMMKGDRHLVALTARLSGSDEVPAVSTAATGRVDAVYDTETHLLRWKATFNGLSGMPMGAHFHGPAHAGANAPIVLGWKAPLSIRYEGQATLTEAQAADLTAGRWYANVHTAAHPAGEIRGQMTVVPK